MTTKEEAIAFWEGHLPGKGQAVVEVIQPFYGRSQEIHPPVAGLERLARHAIFWREFKHVVLIDKNHLDQIKAPLGEGDSLGEALTRHYDELVENLFGEMLVGLTQPSVQSLVEPVFDEVFASQFSENLGRHVMEVASEMHSEYGGFLDRIIHPLYDAGILTFDDFDRCPEPAREMLVASFHDTIYYSCAFSFLGKDEQVQNLRPLRELYLNGNPPFGFDKEGNLLVAGASN